MKVVFLDDSLLKCYEQYQRAVRRWGEKVARKYINRIDRLYAADSAKDLFGMPELRLHPLGGDRKGEYAMDLDGAWRLVLSLSDDMKTAAIKEVSNHYDD